MPAPATSRPVRRRPDLTRHPRAVIGLTFFTLYALYAVSRYRQFLTSGYDLGIFDQAVMQYAHFRPPYVALKGRTTTCSATTSTRSWSPSRRCTGSGTTRAPCSSPKPRSSPPPWCSSTPSSNATWAAAPPPSPPSATAWRGRSGPDRLRLPRGRVLRAPARRHHRRPRPPPRRAIAPGQRRAPARTRRHGTSSS